MFRYLFWARRGWYIGKRPFKNWRNKHPVVWGLVCLTFWCVLFSFFLWFTIFNIQYLMDTKPCERHGTC